MQLCFKEHLMAKENKHDMLIKKIRKKPVYYYVYNLFKNIITVKKDEKKVTGSGCC